MATALSRATAGQMRRFKCCQEARTPGSLAAKARRCLCTRSHEPGADTLRSALMQLMSPAQYDRHEAFQRTGLSKPDVRRVSAAALQQACSC